ncbi:transposase [Ruegeria pomeroyi]|nr:transposase [Ruegeria pomeroyi]MCE8534650.1 transposase [Ruegeria pomeroyi]
MRQAVIHTRQKLNTSERRTCAVLGLSRSSLRYQSKPADDNALRLAMIRLAKQYGWYGYSKVTALLRMEGWWVNHKKVERLWGEDTTAPNKRRSRSISGSSNTIRSGLIMH